MKKKTLISLFAVALAMMMSFDVSAKEGTIEIGSAIENTSIATGNEETEVAEVTVSADEMFTETIYSRSGLPSVAKMSKTSIANTYNTIYKTKYPYYQEKPSTKAPFAAGILNAQHMQYGLASVNMMRQIAGLPGVELKDEYNTYAQHGAVLLAASAFNHTPSCPADMSPDFYQKGYNGTSRGNISSGSSEYFSLADFTKGYMLDNSGSNVPKVGHRRWILNPAMGYTGLGYATAQDGHVNSVLYALDGSKSVPDYDFVSWPASGNFPAQLMSAGDPWSVSLNPEKFKTTSANLNVSAITVTLTAPNGVSKTFTAADNAADVNSKNASYYNIDTAGYGVGNAIVFRPGTDMFGSGNLNGTYTVTVTGIRDSLGAPATICYTVDFFNVDDYATGTVDPGNINKPVDETAVESFVKRLYAKCMGREADDGGLLYWKDRLLSGDVSGAQAAQGFFFGEEYKAKKASDEEFVETLYNVMMDRPSDAQGKADWVYKLKNGVSREGVFKGFCDSAEFSNICKNYGVTKGTITVGEQRDVNPGLTTFISRLYTKALGRDYEVAGLNTWCQRVNSKEWKLDDVSTIGFFHSPEFLNKKLSNSDYVKVLYQTFFDREYDQTGYDYWMGRLNQGTSRDEVLRGFSNSQEFTNLKKSYGL